MVTDTDIENAIRAKGKTGPRITPDMIEAEIVDEDYHVFPRTQLTVCALTLKNGFTVTGESACADPDNFDAELGRMIARDKASNEIWAFLGFRLKDQIAKGEV
ncbi:Gp49 family protein [Celeribacter sp.]|uniref:Gp49 family protein n=1 Tax=Celeribacter sp. TaxID=1890673 RepID=UPI003A904487